MIRDTMLKLRPDAMVVEMCDDRNQRWLSDVIAHPNYEATISDINEMLNKDPEKLKEYDQVDVEDSNMEYLVGIDFCSYRLPCKTLLGDRSYKTTKKRYESKKAMLDVYKEALELQKSAKSFGPSRAAKSSATKTIFDLEEEEATAGLGGRIGLESSVEKLK